MDPTTALAPAAHEDLPAVAGGYPPDANPARVYLARLAPGSRTTQAAALDTIADTLTAGGVEADRFPWHLVRYQHAAALRAALMERYAPATVNRHLCALRGVLREAWRLGYMTAEDCQRAADVRNVRAERLPAGRALTPRDVAALFATCEGDPTPAGRRDAALLAVLYGAGLRRAEAAALQLADYDPDTGALAVRSGKGDKDRLVYATNGAADALADWLAVRGHHAGALFHPITKGGHIEARAMTPHALLFVLRRRAAAAGVVAFTPHDLRRTMITNLLDAGADITTVQRLAGHSNPATTGRYDRRGEDTKRRAAAMLAVPYTGKRMRHSDAQFNGKTGGKRCAG